MTAVHHITGRLRLRFIELKNRRELCHAVEKAIRTLPMVRLVQANAVTGSLLIHYDARGTQQAILLKQIHNILAHQFGFAFSSDRFGKTTASAPCYDSNSLVERMTNMVVEKVVEQSALTLLGLLI